MEGLKFTDCQACGGQGNVNGVKCSTCFAHQSYYFSNNNFLYFSHSINYLHIFVRELRKTIDIIVNLFLLAGVFLTLYLVYSILNLVQFEPRNLWYFLNTARVENFYLWALILADMFLYYRLVIPGIKKADKEKLLFNKDHNIKHNIADHLGQEVSKILDKAWLFGKHKKVFPVSAWHLLFVLLNDRDIRLVLARLGVGADNLKKNIDESIQNLVPAAGNEKFNFDNEARDAILNAYFHMLERQGDYIAEVDLLYGVVNASESVRNMFYDVDIDEQKIDNVIAWVKINKELVTRYKRFRSRSVFKPKGGMNRSYTAIATPVLNSFSQDLTLMAKSGALGLSVAREKEITEVISTVESSLASVVLVGPPGIGKGNIVEGLANRMMAEEIPELFQDKRLVAISAPSLVSGAEGTGRLEERFLAILNETAASGNIILYIEDIHQLVGISSQGTEGVSLAEILASQIRKKNVIVIATANSKEYVQFIEGTSLGQGLKKINITEPDKNQTIKMMEAHVSMVEGRHSVYFTYDSLDAIYELSNRYITDIALPSKAINLMDEAGIIVAKRGQKDNLVRVEDIEAIVSHKTNIPLTQVTSQESAKLLNMEEEIHERIVGQEEAVKLVASALRRARAELRDKNRPIVNLLFLGPTGVGKTELAKTVAEKYFGDENNMIRLDMSEYQNKTSLPRLIGSPQSGTPGLLTEAVRHQPFALLLLDEIEKAHPDILTVFLQVMEDGRLTDALGRTVDFTNLIIVATSNAGTAFIQDQINAGKKTSEFKDQLIKEEIRDIFRPEFINRFDGTVVFRPLTQEEIYKIAGFMLNKVKKRLENKGILLEVTETAQRELAEAGFDPVFGARPLRRVIQERVDNSLAEFLLTGQLGRRDVVVYDVGGKISVKKPTGY
ncbi:MAG: ATP-dependent Clp protease ATP-binding subunit [Candidatus Komeilibacteria bacterium]|jgi:ATP-dependent Clp protease ATP-binding subunit ClpC|nr:ATP-dependent Clp protease ATP-binding subunit [Candidatus Komeilibacteria bacterium]